MAKQPSASRKRRPSRPNVPPYTGPIAAPAAPAASEAAAPVARSAARVSTPTASAAAVDFAREYHYVIKDLRNMGILAAVMLAVLVGLNFIVR